MKKRKNWLRWVGPGFLVLLLDRVVKWLYLAGGAVFPDGAELPTVKNTGMAFGMFQGNSFVILVVSVLLIGGCAFLLRGMRLSGLVPIALSMILGGAAGNMIDRLAYGYVIDMIPFFQWFVFNVADAGVVVGAVLCGWSLLFRPQDWRKNE